MRGLVSFGFKGLVSMELELDGWIGLECERLGSLGVGVEVKCMVSLEWVGNILVVEGLVRP